MSRPRHIEPLLWSLFGAGGTTIGFFFPAIILVVGLCVPLGIIPAEALSYERMSGFFLDNLFGKLALLVVLIPSYWGCIHRIYHGMHDLGIHAGSMTKMVCYGGTLLLSLATVFYVI